MACKITRKLENREITLAEFKKQKNMEPYSTYRQSAKSLNFLLVFGGSESVLSSTALEPKWTDEQIDQFLAENDCRKSLEKVKLKYSKEKEDKQRYIAVANYMRDGFFKNYPQLLERCTREVAYAEKHGFCRSVFGGTRNFIELRLAGSHDAMVLSKLMRNISNVAKNYRAQNFEACVRGRAMRETQDWLEANGYKTKVWNEIHDSVDFWLHRDELFTLYHIKHVFERKIPELAKQWVPLLIDCAISDLLKGEYYKGGQSPEAYSIRWDEYSKYLDTDPFHVELTKEYDEEYFKGRKEFYASQGIPDPLQDKIDIYVKEEGLNI